VVLESDNGASLSKGGITDMAIQLLSTPANFLQIVFILLPTITVLPHAEQSHLPAQLSGENRHPANASGTLQSKQYLVLCMYRHPCFGETSLQKTFPPSNNKEEEAVHCST
jgi:hypothetical protein